MLQVWDETMGLIYQITLRGWYGTAGDAGTGEGGTGEGGEGGGTGGEGSGTGGEGSGTGGEGTGEGTGGEGGTGEKTFTQTQVNQIMAQNRRNLQAKLTAVESQLAEAQSGSLSAEERVTLTKRVKELSDSLKTKEELARQENERIKNESEERIKTLEADYNALQERYTGETITRSITDAAAANDAFAPDQIVALLRPITRLQEKLGEDGTPTGDLVPMAKITGMNEEGKELELDLPVNEAVKVMKETPQKYGNLFKSTANGGLGFDGGTGGSGSGGGKDVANMTTEQYVKARKEGKIDLGKV